MKAPVVEEEEVKGLTLQEYLAQKKRSTLKKEARGHDEVKKNVLLEAAAGKKERIETINSTLKDQEVYNVAVGKTELSNLLSFQG